MLVIVSLAVTLAVGEITFRFYQKVAHDIPYWGAYAGPNTTNDVLGWAPKANYRMDSFVEDRLGVKYQLFYRSYRDGFREFGDIASKKVKVFFVGDSYTQAVEVSNDKTYYAVVRRRLPVEVFAYGGGGFGSLQEYMIVDQFFDQITPDLIVWQCTSNDFINNDFELEFNSVVNNNAQRRPYWSEDRIVYKIPLSPLGQTLRSFVGTAHSRLLNFTDYQILRLYSILKKDKTVEMSIAQQQDRHNGFNRSVRTTGAILNMVKRRARGTPVVAFCVDDTQPYYNAFAGLAQTEGFQFLDGIPEAIRRAELAGRNTPAADGAHWNELGHQLAGASIATYLQEWLQTKTRSRTRRYVGG